MANGQQTATLAGLQRWLTRIDALTLRERAILLLVALLALYFLAQRLILQPTLLELEQNRLQIAELQSSLTALQLGSTQLGTAQQDPLQQRRQRIAELEAQLAAQDRELEAELGRLLQPQQAAALLQDLLQEHRDLRLISLDTSPASALPGQASAATRLARYRLDVTVEGSYLAILAYVQRLEQLPWTLIWDDFTLRVENHPRSRAQLRLYTLGQRL